MDGDDAFGIFLGVLAIAFFVMGVAGGCESGYESGQKDAAKGKWYWRLKDEGGGEKVFRKFPEPATQPVEK